jgi:P27 family predicted phage terminase small subunit
MRKLDTDTKILQGTYEANKEGFEPVEYRERKHMPKPKEEWPPRIKKIWDDRCLDLKNSGYLVNAFVPSLVMYCDWLSIYYDAVDSVNREGYVVQKEGSQGQTYPIVNPSLAVMDMASKWIDKINQKFGFTPLDVQRIPVVRKAEESDTSLLK